MVVTERVSGKAAKKIYRNNRRELFDDIIAEMRNGEILGRDRTEHVPGTILHDNTTDLHNNIRYMYSGSTHDNGVITKEFFKASEVGTEMQEKNLNKCQKRFEKVSIRRIMDVLSGKKEYNARTVNDNAMSEFDARMARKMYLEYSNEKRIQQLLEEKFMYRSMSLKKLRSDSASQWVYEDMCLDYLGWGNDEEPEWCQQRKTYESEENTLLLENQRLQKEFDVVNIVGRQHFEDIVANCMQDILADLEGKKKKDLKQSVTVCQAKPVDELSMIVNSVDSDFCQPIMDSDFSEAQVELDRLGITVEEVTDICATLM